MATYTFYCDPSHAWLKVPKRALVDLGIEKQITHFSYIRGDYVYLEEDCDAGTFLDAAKNRNWPISIRESYGNKRSRIRNYERYEVPMSRDELMETIENLLDLGYKGAFVDDYVLGLYNSGAITMVLLEELRDMGVE